MNLKAKVRYPHKLPKEYLEEMAEKICSMKLSEAIVYNTLRDIFCKGYTNGYNRRQEEVVRFTAQKERHLEDSFKGFKDEIDDLIHKKSDQPKTA